MYTIEKNINILWKEFIKTEVIESRDEYLYDLKLNIEYLQERIESNEKWIVFYWVVLFFTAITNIILWLSLIW